MTQTPSVRRGDLAIIRSTSRISAASGSGHDAVSYRLAIVTSITRATPGNPSTVKAYRGFASPDSPTHQLKNLGTRDELATVPAAALDMESAHAEIMAALACDETGYLPAFTSAAALLAALVPNVSDPAVLAPVRRWADRDAADRYAAESCPCLADGDGCGKPRCNGVPVATEGNPMSDTLPGLAFTAPQAALADALTFADAAIPRRVAVPVLAGVLITADADGVTVAANTYEQWRTVRVAAEVTRPGRILVGCRSLRDIVKGLDKGAPVTVDANRDGVAVRSGDTAVTVPLMPVEDYPTVSGPADTVGTADLRTLAAVVAAVAPALGTDVTLPMMTHFEVTPAGGVLEFVATDRYRMTMGVVDWQPACADTAAMLWPGQPTANVIKAYAKAAGKTPGTVTIGHTGDSERNGVVSLSFGPYTFSAVDGGPAKHYPRVRALFPPSYETTGTVDGVALAATLKRVASSAGKEGPTRLTWSDGGLTVCAGSENNVLAAEALPCTYGTAEPLTIAANGAFVAAALATLTGSSKRPVAVEFGFNGARKPFTVTTDGSCRHLIMPIHIPSQPAPAVDAAPQEGTPVTETTSAETPPACGDCGQTPHTGDCYAARAHAQMMAGDYADALALVASGEAEHPQHTTAGLSWADLRAFICTVRDDESKRADVAAVHQGGSSVRPASDVSTQVDIPAGGDATAADGAGMSPDTTDGQPDAGVFVGGVQVASVRRIDIAHADAASTVETQTDRDAAGGDAVDAVSTGRVAEILSTLCTWRVGFTGKGRNRHAVHVLSFTQRLTAAEYAAVKATAVKAAGGGRWSKSVVTGGGLMFAIPADPTPWRSAQPTAEQKLAAWTASVATPAADVAEPDTHTPAVESSPAAAVSGLPEILPTVDALDDQTRAALAAAYAAAHAALTGQPIASDEAAPATADPEPVKAVEPLSKTYRLAAWTPGADGYTKQRKAIWRALAAVAPGARAVFGATRQDIVVTVELSEADADAIVSSAEGVRLAAPAVA